MQLASSVHAVGGSSESGLTHRYGSTHLPLIPQAFLTSNHWEIKGGVSQKSPTVPPQKSRNQDLEPEGAGGHCLERRGFKSYWTGGPVWRPMLSGGHSRAAVRPFPTRGQP
ncbi:hypothetical protein H1C71_032550 [Ictidomys tridecemlineatus]|nr:hypothetical protein H1C71_032550 [Ictidomys tridecemlineatus]